MDNSLFRLARLVAVNHEFDFPVVSDKGLASATTKIEDVKSTLIGFITSSFPDAAAFDMEGWGFYRAGARQLCLWIKAVADRGESQDSSLAGQELKRITQAQVTRNAMNFAITLTDEYRKTKLYGAHL